MATGKQLGRLIVQGNPSSKCLLGCRGSNSLYVGSLNPTHFLLVAIGFWRVAFLVEQVDS
jgi:hypothetical protein